jgi:hypothetical protein
MAIKPWVACSRNFLLVKSNYANRLHSIIAFLMRTKITVTIDKPFDEYLAMTQDKQNPER